MAEKEKKTLDPMADLTPEYISNMDMNAPINDANNSLEMYGDDSSKDNYKTLGGKAEKYTGEWVKTSDVPYDENITTEWLDPNYLFGKESKVYGTQHRGYISQRNDMIASALYNEWKTSMEDVADYLYQQKWFTNSTEDERKNTITSIWKRLWEMKWEPEENQIDSSAMEEELLGKEDEKIYGKTTPDSWKTEEGITALSDANSIHDMMSKERISNVKTLLSTPVESIAISLYKWDIPWDMQAIVDYKTFYPEQWALVEQELKRIRGQWTVNALTKGETVPSNTNGTSAANNEIANFAADNATDTDSMSDILKWVHQTLQSNQAATSASETMADIESDIIDLTNRLQNLRKEANQIFKWDTPDYIVNAYINNRTQEIQNELQKLEQRYQYASNRYDKEVANAQWEKEFWLKERQVKIQEETLELNKEKANLWLDSTVPSQKVNTNPKTSTSLGWKELPMTTKTRAEISNIIDNLVDMYNKWQIGNAQCWVWIQTYYLPELWISFGTISLYWEKLAIRNEGRDYTPQKWDLIIMASWTAPKNWHIGIVIWMTEDGKVQYLDWNGLNGKGAEEPAIREIDPKSAKIQGYYNATKWFAEENINADGSLSWWQYYEWKPYNIDYIPYYEKILGAKYTSQWWQAADAENLWLTNAEFREQAYTYKKAKEAWMLDVNDPILKSWWKWTRNDGKVFDFSLSSIYKTLSDVDKQAVQDLLNNSISKAYINSNRTKYDNPSWIFAAVWQIDPEWSETLYKNREKAENKRSVSEQWGYISKNKTAMAKAREVYELADTLEDQSWKSVSKFFKNNNIKTLKDLYNWKETQMWNTDVVRLKVALDWFINEYAWALKWGNASNAVEDILREENIFSLWLSQDQLKEAMKEAARTLYDKDVTEVHDLTKWTYLRQPVTWLEDDANWLYSVVWLSLDKYYDYTPVGWTYDNKDWWTTDSDLDLSKYMNQ